MKNASKAVTSIQAKALCVVAKVEKPRRACAEATPAAKGLGGQPGLDPMLETRKFGTDPRSLRGGLSRSLGPFSLTGTGEAEAGTAGAHPAKE
jgi:hypothetical protein